MKSIFIFLALLLVGCATTNDFQKRKTERLSAYNTLSPEFKAAVDQGQIKVGMPEDAVYIVWGPPAQILRSGGAQGEITRWLYTGSYMEEYRYWNGSRRRGYPSSRLQFDYLPRDYVSAEVVFANGTVKSWTMEPQPTN